MVASRKRPFSFHPEARSEVRAGTRWYRDRDPRVSDRFIDELGHGVDRACLLPDSFPPYLYGTRKASLGRFPFLIIFRESRDRIQILAVAHTSRRPGYWRERLGDDI